MAEGPERIIPPLPVDPTLQQLDDYVTAAKFLMRKALTSGDGLALRAINTLMSGREAQRTLIRLALEDYEWLGQGRGPYAFDDQGYDADVRLFYARVQEVVIYAPPAA